MTSRARGSCRPVGAFAGPLIAAALVVVGCAPASAPDPSGGGPAGSPATHLRIAAAADLRYAMDAVVAAWSATHPSVKAEAIYGSSGSFLAQISAGAPFDLFFSADASYPRELERTGLVAADSTRLYAIGQIVVWVPADSPLDIGEHALAALADPSVGTVAIANPEHAPYGQAAVAAMRSAGVYEAIEPKLVLGENVSQALQFVESGGADAGIIALSLATAAVVAERGRFAIVPIESYPRLEQGAVVLAASSDPVAAGAFLDFVLGTEGRAVLDRFGFILPSP